MTSTERRRWAEHEWMEMMEGFAVGAAGGCLTAEDCERPGFERGYNAGTDARRGYRAQSRARLGLPPERIEHDGDPEVAAAPAPAEDDPRGAWCYRAACLAAGLTHHAAGCPVAGVVGRTAQHVAAERAACVEVCERVARERQGAAAVRTRDLGDLAGLVNLSLPTPGADASRCAGLIRGRPTLEGGTLALRDVPDDELETARWCIGRGHDCHGDWVIKIYQGTRTVRFIAPDLREVEASWADVETEVAHRAAAKESARG